jgi:hypothetical protein
MFALGSFYSLPPCIVEEFCTPVFCFSVLFSVMKFVMLSHRAFFFLPVILIFLCIFLFPLLCYAALEMLSFPLTHTM